MQFSIKYVIFSEHFKILKDIFFQLDLLLTSTLYIMDKVNPNSLNEKSINPELMVRCIRSVDFSVFANYLSLPGNFCPNRKT
jgi:hypothetical protein